MKIALLDDHGLFAESIKNLVEHANSSHVVSIYNSAKDFLDSTIKSIPDILISDILMKGMSGLELLAEVKKTFGENCKVILLSSITDIYTIKDAFKKGADAYVSKDAKKEELFEAIEKVSEGGQYINSSLKDRLFKHMFVEEEIIFHLTTREKEVLNRICKGSTPKEISADMKLSIHTVQQYIANIMQKFKVNRTTELVVFAIQKGLYNPEG